MPWKQPLETARAIVACKLQAQQICEKRWRRNAWLEESEGTELSEFKARIQRSTSIAELMLVEAQSSRQHFKALGAVTPPGFEWNGRNRQPPRDSVNALLSLTYMMVMGEAVSMCYACGLDPFIGFLHQLDYGRPSLALDILEPLRALYCDHFVIRLLQSDFFSDDDFTCNEENGCRLSTEALRRYIDKYQAFTSAPSGKMKPIHSMLEQLLRALSESIRTRSSLSWDHLLREAA